MQTREAGALTAFAAVLAITGAWWALALWPMADAPAWMARAQAVCFNTQPNGLPDASGWLALILQPALMFTLLAFITGDALGAAVRTLARGVAGRIALAGLGLLIPLSLGAVTWRVTTAPKWANEFGADAQSIPTSYPRLDRDAPPLDLVDQHGKRFSLDRLAGRPVLVTFAFAHCQTVCPVVVSDVLKAAAQLGDTNPVPVVVTLDPWRDVPSRLPAIARQWGVGGDGLVLSGSVAEVEAALDQWNVARARDESTGDVTHPRLIYIIDSAGRIAYAVNGGVAAIVELVGRMEGRSVTDH